MFKVYIVSVLVSCCIQSMLCNWDGAPSKACDDVSPVLGHGSSTASGASPFKLTLSQTNFSAGDTVQVTLSGGTFQGFLIVANSTTGNINIGSFTDLPPNTKLTCTSARGVTHTDGKPKTSVTFNWTAPLDSVDDIVFKYAVVKDSMKNYFDNLTSSILRAAPITSGYFTRDSECGKTKGCYSNCINNVCDWETSWQDKGDYLIISLKSSLTNASGYVSLGFSNTSKMGPATVYYCVLYNNSINVIPGVTIEPYGHREVNLSKDGISHEVNNFTDGVLQCTFDLQKVTNDSQLFHLNESWYLIIARGPVREGVVKYHVGRNSTNHRVNLTDMTTDEYFTSQSSSHSSSTTSLSTIQTLAGKFHSDQDCGSKKGCYSRCSNNQCDFLVTWVPKGNNFEFSLTSSTGSNGDYYIAIGFNKDQKMSVASVVACTVTQDRNVDIFVSTNTGYRNTPLNNPKEGVVLLSGSYKDGILQCTFTRFGPAVNKTEAYDLNQPWYLITARGDAKAGGVLLQHDADDRFISQAQIDFKKFVEVSLEVTKYHLIKAHGCLMVITWMFLASIGLSFARFLKPLWPSSMPCGVKVWFAMHRAFMVLAFLSGCAGFIIIFVEVQEYSEIKGEFYTKAHPILGIITTALLVINPFMSLLRCGPDDPRRPYFNWAHRAAGTIAQILATITVTVGLYLPKAQVNSDVGLAIMVAYSAWHLCYFLIMSLLNDLKVNIISKKKKSGNSFAMNHLDQIDGDDNKKVATSPNFGLKKFLLFLHVLVLSGLTIALLYFLIDGNV